MISIIAGKRGVGKTKLLLDQANQCITTTMGSVLYLDKDSSHMYELDRKIRLINVSDFPIASPDGFIGFICGILSQDHDISDIFLDDFYSISKSNLDDVDDLVKKLEDISRAYKVNFVISLLNSEEDLTPYAKQYVKISL